jgi:16S rRNA (guanine966-N2)-methyltransferase
MPRRGNSGKRPGTAGSNRIRIIGGSHRGRKLPFPDLPGLRPSGDRVRETLFNWLQPFISGARCLDLFAGSGALGLEAASRGAAEVVLVDRAPQAARQLRENVALLGLEGAEVVQADGIQWLAGTVRSFDIVFLDPPFADRLLSQCLRSLVDGGWLTRGARVYLESDAAMGLPELPQKLEWEKTKRMGQVAFGLARSATE